MPVLRSPWGRRVKPSLAQTARSATPSTPSPSSAQHQPETRAYLDCRIADGKTKRQAPRALERQISRDVFKRLNDIACDQSNGADSDALPSNRRLCLPARAAHLFWASTPNGKDPS